MQLLAAGPQDYAEIGRAGIWRGFVIPEGGLEPPETLQMLEGWSARLIAAQGWGTWLGVTGEEVVASLAVKETLADGAVEIGYGVAPARRGMGLGTAAVCALLPLLAARGASLVRAETSVLNPASGRVLDKAGFARCGTRVDAEDGALVLWQRPLPGG